MANSSRRTGETPPTTDKRHGTRARGPGDVVSDEEVQRELVEEDREFGDEAAADVATPDTGDETPPRNKPSPHGNAPVRRRKPARPQFGLPRSKR